MLNTVSRQDSAVDRQSGMLLRLLAECSRGLVRSLGVAAIVSCGVAIAPGSSALAEPTTAVQPSVAQSVSEEEAFEIGVEAYQYFYPLISMEITRQVTTNLPAGAKPGMGPMNVFHHLREYPKADFREVVRPNFDTLYSVAWLDLTKEPQILSLPDTQDRYYLMPLLDMWSNVFAVPGKRTSGTKAGNWAIVPQGWQGSLPSGVDRIDAPTLYVWIIGRTQTNGPKDYAAVHKVQDGYTITPLSRWGKPVEAPTFKPDPSVDMKTPPLVQVNTMPADRYFALAADLMTKHPPQVTDWSMVARLERIGIVVGQPFEFAKTPAHVQSALRRATTAGLAGMQARVPTMARVVDGWQVNTDTMGVYGNAYLKRAVVAMVGLGANQPEDAVYPLNIADADGKPITGENRYELHFTKDQLPPVGAFWSVTMYDNEGFQVANPINRFAIGDRDALKFNSDGSLTLYIQHKNPGLDKEANWLPTPASGKLGITMRLYAPKLSVLDGRWSPPPIRSVK